MSHHAWVLKEGLRAAEDVHIGSAQADAAHPQQYLARCGQWRRNLAHT